MIKSLGSDNHSGVHPQIMEALISANLGHSPSYGQDTLSQEVQSLFKKYFGDSSETHFVFNGTAANVLAIKYFLSSHHSVLCSEDSHLNNDECGAPEFITGCKLIPINGINGKLTPELCRQKLVRLGDQHISQPKMLSITQPTELGTLYTLNELQKLGEFCRQHQLYFHIDGARFILAAHQLKCSFSELTRDIGVDVLSFGGTKNGLLFGEAVILLNPATHGQFKFIRKQCLQLPSKMRFVASQFKTLLENNLWNTIAEHECQLAQYLKNRLLEVPLAKIIYPVEANSVFVQIPKEWTKPLRDSHFFYVWDEQKWIVRLMLSFDSQQTDIDQFISRMKEL